mgnify:CR=1 FL=1
MRNIRIEFLLEEESMSNFLKIILPKILPSDIILDRNCFLRPHSGKSDLAKSIPIKVRAFSNKTKFVIIDLSDCKKLKNDLSNLIIKNGGKDFLIRIPCRELESWYLGDMESIEKVYPGFKAKNYKNKAAFRNPDECHASKDLSRICPDFQKGYASKNIAKYMDINTNNSKSFNVFINGI